MLAEGTVDDWLVALHWLEVDTNGDIFIVLSSLPVSGSPASREWEAPEPEAVDNLGVRYVASSAPRGKVRGYCNFTLHPERTEVRPGAAQAVTITVRPRRSDLTSGQTVAFHNLALPPPSKEAGDWGRWSEVVQY